MSKKIILKGTTEDLKPIITQLLAFNQIVENLDLEGTGGYESSIDPGRRFHPFVNLIFRKDSDFVAGTNQPKGRGKNRSKARISFRLMNETTTSISKANLTTIGTAIKNTFGANNGYVWNKGKELFCYADWDKGYQLQILATTETHAKDVVTKVLSIQGHTPTWKYMSKTGNLDETNRYPAVAQTQTILGETITLPLLRPKVDVRFMYAEAQIHPLTNKIILYDRTSKKANALVT